MAGVIQMPDKGLTFDAFMSKRSRLERSQDGDGVRRVTGSADIPLNAEGKQQAEELAEDTAKPYDLVLTSPEKRAIDTAKEFGTPIALGGLDAWRRGKYEGQPVEQCKGAIRFLMQNPDKRPPGISPISKEPGESLNEFAKPLLATVQAIRATMEPEDRVLICSHGGNLQTIDAWLRSGAKDDLSFDNREMSKTPYWSVVGCLYRMGDKKLDEVKNNAKPGLYLLEHTSTSFNSAPPAQEGGGPNKRSAVVAERAGQRGADGPRHPASRES